MSTPTKILLVDDHQILLDGLEALLGSFDHLDIAGRVTDGKDVIPFLHKTKVDVIIMDINMAEMDGIEVLEQLSKLDDPPKTIILSSYDDLKLVQEALKFGANGYLTKQSVTDHLIDAINKVLEGKNYYDEHIESKIFRAFSSPNATETPQVERALVRQLTEREIEVLKLIAAQYTSDEIATQLYIAKSTVDTHRKNLIRKLQVKNAVGLGLFAERNGIL